MRVFSHFHIAAFLLAAVTVHADTGYAYATITGGNSPTVVAIQSLNSANGPITVSHTATGQYTVTFANSGIGEGWAVLASPLNGAPGAYCSVEGWGGAGVANIDCYGPGGVALDNSFNVLAVSNQNDKNIAFAWANQSSAASYNPLASYSYNPAGTISITRQRLGGYQVAFNGLSSASGTVQITAYGSNAQCVSNGWETSSYVSVQCFSPTGAPVDTQYSIAVVTPGATPTGLAYTNTGGNTPVNYNPTGMPVAISHPATGSYTVTYYGLSSVPVNGGAVFITADRNSARCVTPSWNIGSPAFAFVVNIACYDTAGNLTDTAFELLVLPPMGYAYAAVDSNLTIVTPWSVNPGVAPITVTRVGTGSYVVTFPNSGIGPGWIAHAWAAFGSGQWCEPAAWNASLMGVECYSPSGVPADSGFEILAISNTNGESMAFAWANQPSAASYSPSPEYSYNPAGAISIARLSAGAYQVVFQGLNGAGGTVQVVQVDPFGGATNACNVQNWASPNFQANVNCVDLNGNPSDTEFAITVISDGATPPDVSYFWADQPSSSNYTDSGVYWYRPSGSTSIQRLGTGNYAYGDEAIAAPTSYNTPVTRCSTIPTNGEIQCYGLSGAPADTRYDLLMMEPIPNRISLGVLGGTVSAVVTTAYAGLAVQVIDVLTGNFISAPLVFAAPTSGASGTFAGGASTVVVVPGPDGVAIAPTFTANNTPGSFTVSVYLASYDVETPVQFTLTNLPLTSVTLQTSPAGLPVSFGGNSYGDAPQSASLIGGNSQTIAASPTVGTNNVQYVWQSWSDGGAASHSITVPFSNTTYTATYKTQYQLTASANPAGEGSAATAGNATYFDAGTNAGVTATPAAGYRFLNWTGNVANAQNASTTVDMTAPTAVTANFALSCDVLGNASATGADVAKILGQALRGPAQFDMNSDGVVNVVDIQMVLNAARGLACLSK